MILTTRRLFVAILFVALFGMTAREIADPDFWWHLSTGKYILASRTIPRVDVFSGTFAGQPWVAHEWLSEVFIYTVFAVGSYPALILVFSALITLAFAFAYARCQGKPYVAAFALLIAAVATAPMWGVRPQMISLLLTSVFLWVLDRWIVSASHAEQSEGTAKQSPATTEIASSQPFDSAEFTLSSAEGLRSGSLLTTLAPHASAGVTHSKSIWILVPLMILWVNLHSGYALGLAIIAIYLLGAIIEGIIQPSNRPTIQLPNHPTTQLALVFLVCLAVVPLNPNGATMYVYPFETLTSRAMQTYIQEWFSPDFHLIEFQPFAWLLLATLAAIGLSGKRMSLTQTLLLLGSGYAALRSARNIPIFAIIAAPILAEHLWHIVEARGWATGLTKASRLSRGMAIGNWVLLAVIIAAGTARVGMVTANQSAVERDKFPAAAVDFLQARQVTGTIYDSYGWGGYLIWRLYPGARVFIDGRADVYGDAFIENAYLKAYRGSEDWRAPLDRYGVRVVLIEPDAPLVTQLAQDAAWKKVYEDKQAVVFEKQ